MSKNAISQILKSAGIKGKLARQIGGAIEQALTPAQEDDLDSFWLEIPIRIKAVVAQKGNVNLMPDRSDIDGQIKGTVEQWCQGEIDLDAYESQSLDDDEELDLDDLQEAKWRILKG